MFKIILAFAVTAVFLRKDCTAVYDIEGDHYGKDGNLHEGDSDVDVVKYGSDVAEEFKEMLKLRNAGLIASKYAEDVVYLRQGHPLAFDREAVKGLYQEWFDDKGVYGADITIVKAFTLGEDYPGAIVKYALYDSNRLNIGGVTALVIFKRTEAGDGFKTYLKSEIEDYWKE